MTEQSSMRTMPPRLLLLLCAIAFVASFATIGSSDAHIPVSDPVDASATPAGIRARIDIGPIRELVPILRRQDDEEISEFLYLVEDPNGVLSQSQANVLAEDAHRLTVHGIPTMFVLRESEQTPEESAVYASQLRSNKNLETRPGADDGILFLVTRNGEKSKRSMFLTISYGAHTLPKGGLNETTLQEVYQQSIRPRMRFGLISDALKVGIRKIIYLETYYPDPSPPLTSLQEATRSTVNIAGPILSAAGLFSVVLSWRSNKPGAPVERRNRRRRYALAIVLTGGSLMILAALAVYSHSGPGILAVSIGVLAIAAHIRLFIGGSTQSRPPVRRIHAIPRLAEPHRLRARSALRRGPRQ